MRSLRHYALVYRQYLSMSLANALIHRTHFCLLIVFEMVFYFTSIAGLEILFRAVPNIGGWDRNQALLLLSFMLAVDQLHMTFVSENFWQLGDDIRLGALDYHLLRPIGSLFPVFFRSIRCGTLAILPLSWLILIYYGHQAGLAGLDWLLLPALVLLAALLQTVIDMVIVTLLFWTVGADGVNFVRINLQTVARWPREAFLTGFRFVFTFVIPVLLIGNAPVAFLLDSSRWQILGGMGLAILVSLYSLKVMWQAGLRRYESASS